MDAPLRLVFDDGELLAELRSDYERGGDTAFDDLLLKLAVPPSQTTVRVNTVRVSRDELIAELEAVLREQGALSEFPVQPSPLVSDVVTLPCTGPHHCERHRKVIVVDTACGTALLRGANLYAAGVLGATPGIRVGNAVSVVVDVEGKCLRGAKNFSGVTEFIGNGVAEMNMEDIFRAGSEVRGVAVRMSEGLYRTPALGDVLPDRMFLQNLPSCVAAHVLAPERGHAVLDMCASPGGKTTHVAALMADEGLVIALDRSPPKADIITRLAERLGLTCIAALPWDATTLVQSDSGGAASVDELRALAQLPLAELKQRGLPKASFDRVLLDAPCSALGLRPRLRVEMRAKQLNGYAIYQKRLFAQAVQLLKPGGTLVYSTCTINVRENEQMVAWALSEFSFLSLAPQTPYIGEAGLAGHGLDDGQRGLVQRFDPRGPLDTPGFFIAKFVAR